MQYIAIGQFGMDPKILSELASLRKNYTYPPEWKNVRSFMDVQGGRVITYFETNEVETILLYTSTFPGVSFDIFPVVPTEKAWGIYLSRKH